MGKIKYQGGITKYFAKRKGNKNRVNFVNNMSQLDQVIRQFPERPCDMSLVSYSSKSDFPEQILSVLSFLRHCGTPLLWTIYSDGSHTEEEYKMAKKNFAFLTIIKTDFKDSAFQLKPSLSAYRKVLLDYANSKFPLGKKLLYFLNHPVQSNTIFLDSDILFYEKASEIGLLNEPGTSWFLPEWIWGTLDSAYLKKYPKTLYQINSGFFKLSKELVPDSGLEYLGSLNGDYEYFTEQTTIHTILLNNHLIPLDPRLYYLKNDDQFDFAYNFKRSDIAIRHFTSPVRHKMWQRDWKWQLSL